MAEIILKIRNKQQQKVFNVRKNSLNWKMLFNDVIMIDLLLQLPKTISSIFQDHSYLLVVLIQFYILQNLFFNVV
jgi:hypothetical protein